MNIEFEIYYKNNKIKNNQFLTPSDTNKQPIIKYNNYDDKLYTIIMYDPDAINGTFVHWAIVNIPGNNINNGDILLPYKGPSPPYNTGKHRYIFNLYEQSNKIEKDKILNRNMSINNIENLLKINNPVAVLLFLSEYENNKKGGKTYKKRNKTNKRNKPNKKNKKNKRSKRSKKYKML
jgi:hypothetical protein